jgi:DNA repair protein RadC
MEQLRLNDEIFVDLSDPVVRKKHIDKISKEIIKATQIREQIDTLYKTLNKTTVQAPKERVIIHRPRDVSDLMEPMMNNLSHEELWTILLNTRNYVMIVVKIYQGNVSSSQVRIGEVLRPSVIYNAPALVIVHNHPSGDPSPSPEDISLTKTIRSACKLFDLDLLDHIIIGVSGQFTSLKEKGYGFD